MIVDDIKRLREMVDEFYELTTRKKIESDLYLEINNQINKILGEAMSLIVKGE